MGRSREDFVGYNQEEEKLMLKCQVVVERVWMDLYRELGRVPMQEELMAKFPEAQKAERCLQEISRKGFVAMRDCQEGVITPSRRDWLLRQCKRERNQYREEHADDCRLAALIQAFDGEYLLARM